MPPKNASKSPKNRAAKRAPNSSSTSISAAEKVASKKSSKKVAHKTVQKREGKSKSKNLVDIFNEHAVTNAYYTCHNVQDLLKIRGFPWPELNKKKKKSKK